MFFWLFLGVFGVILVVFDVFCVFLGVFFFGCVCFVGLRVLLGGFSWVLFFGDFLRLQREHPMQSPTFLFPGGLF